MPKKVVLFAPLMIVGMKAAHGATAEQTRNTATMM
jgi:hypothetical protein